MSERFAVANADLTELAIMAQLEQSVQDVDTFKASNRTNLATIFAETVRNAKYLSNLYHIAINGIRKTNLELLERELTSEKGSFEGGVLADLRQLLDKRLEEIEGILKEKIKELWSRVEKENGIVVGPDDEMGDWGSKITAEQLDEAMKRLEVYKGTFGDVEAD